MKKRTLLRSIVLVAVVLLLIVGGKASAIGQMTVYLPLVLGGQLETPSPTPTPTEEPPNCDPSYPTVCIPPPTPDLDCGDIPYRRFTVLPPDPNNFDGDGDGIGCET